MAGKQGTSSILIKSHQISSIVVDFHQLSSNLVNYRRLSSDLIRAHQTPSDPIRPHQTPSDPIRPHQTSSETRSQMSAECRKSFSTAGLEISRISLCSPALTLHGDLWKPASLLGVLWGGRGGRREVVMNACNSNLFKRTSTRCHRRQPLWSLILCYDPK